MLGLKRGTVKVVPYNPEWATSYANEAEALKKLLGARISAIEHVGSTAIPDLHAKPIIDIDICLIDFSKAHELQELLAPEQYTLSDLIESDSHILFEKSHPVTTHHLHVFPHGSTAHAATVLFRDTLRANPGLAQEYELLKLSLQREFEKDREAYLIGKAEFIQKVINETGKAPGNA